MGGDFFVNVAPKGYPESNKPQDTLILHFLGNNMFAKKNAFFQRFHMVIQDFLDDEKINLLISKVSCVLRDIKLVRGKFSFLDLFRDS